MQKAKEVIESGQLGRVLLVNAMFWLFKPDDYFDIEWRRQDGAGPVFLNLIHDVDNLRHLFGEVVSVQARESNAVRGNPVEETSVILLVFESGLLATLSVCDSVVAPWSWEMTTGENPAYPKVDTFLLLYRWDPWIADNSQVGSLEKSGQAQLVGTI